MHPLKSQPIIQCEASQTEWSEPFDCPTGISGFPMQMVSTPDFVSTVAIKDRKCRQFNHLDYTKAGQNLTRFDK